MEFPVITICGSMRYYQQMLEVACNYTRHGYIVLMPFVTDYTGVDNLKAYTGQMGDYNLKVSLDRMHLVKIDMSEGIVVIGSYIGESTGREIDYARAHGKWVRNVPDKLLNELHASYILDQADARYSMDDGQGGGSDEDG